MRLSDLKEDDKQLDELGPMLGAAPAAGTAPAAAPTAPVVGQPAPGLAAGGMNPVQAAQAKKAHDDQKKQLQDQIKQTQTQLANLQKQLAALG